MSDLYKAVASSLHRQSLTPHEKEIVDFTRQEMLKTHSPKGLGEIQARFFTGQPRMVRGRASDNS